MIQERKQRKQVRNDPAQEEADWEQDTLLKETEHYHIGDNDEEQEESESEQDKSGDNSQEDSSDSRSNTKEDLRLALDRIRQLEIQAQRKNTK